MSRFNESLQEAARSVARHKAATEAATAASLTEALARRPRLSAGTIFQSLDWVLDHQLLLGQQTALYLQAIELGVRVMATEAQGKATQHTLVQDGVLDPPPAAS